MHYYQVAPTKIARAGEAFFTYSSEQVLSPGHIVQIPLGKQSVLGVVLSTTTKPSFATREIISIVEPTPLPSSLLKLGQWLSDYYATPLATTLQTVLPRGLTKQRRPRVKPADAPGRERTTFVLNSDQQAAIDAIDQQATGTSLLHGITGSGKTAIYIEIVKQTLASGRSAIVLVPEIALTSQLVAEFSQHFPDTILTHSRQTESERHLAWKSALASAKPRVVIGPRSALFMPLDNIGVVIIDEAHEPSYKQDQSPRYSALRAAAVLCDQYQARLILGSATPAVADYYLAKEGGGQIIKLDKLARLDAVRPDIELVDMTKRQNFKRHRFLSDKLLAQIDQTLANGKQVLIFHNRRGSASSTLCENCGWIAGCPRCFVPLTLHADQHILRCHICNFKDKIKTACPECGQADVIHKGIGTKLIESELTKLYPEVSIARFDGDTDIDSGVDKRYNDIYSGKIKILIGTQVIAKGLDLPDLRTVGVIQADAGLSLPDYSASERAFQLLAQVVGRVGRSSHATNVIVQSYQPTHPSVTTGVDQDYDSFYKFAIAERRRANFPPFSFLLKLTCVYKTEAAAIRNAQKLATHLRREFTNSQIDILGPAPAFYERSRDTYRWQLIIRAKRRASLVEVLKHLPPTHWQYDLDPASLL